MKAIILFLAIFLFSCTTINLDEPLFARPPTMPHSGVFDDDGMDTDSFNPDPPPFIYARYHKTPHAIYFIRLHKKIERWNKRGQTVKEFTAKLHVNDGINWRRGEVQETWIYFVQKER